MDDVRDAWSPGDHHDGHPLQPAAYGLVAALMSMLLRNVDDAMSAAPPTASVSTATQSIAPRACGASPTAAPKHAIARPHTTIAHTTAMP